MYKFTYNKFVFNMATMKLKRMSKQANPISTIVFDLDNTLIPTRKGDTKACNKVIEHNMNYDVLC